jgi:hypothetical protein
MQVVNFKTNSQPQYIALSAEGKILAAPIGYSTKDEYLSFLRAGLGKANP